MCDGDHALSRIRPTAQSHGYFYGAGGRSAYLRDSAAANSYSNETQCCCFGCRGLAGWTENCAAMEDTAAQRQRIQMVLLRESGMTQPAIAAAMGASLSTVNRAHMAYDHGSIEALKPRPNGGRKHENMTLAEEEALLARFAKAAGAGEMLNIHDLKAAYEKAIGHRTSDSTVYNLLHRHGWRKLMPRPFHPKRDLAAQNAFKKTAFLML